MRWESQQVGLCQMGRLQEILREYADWMIFTPADPYPSVFFRLWYMRSQDRKLRWKCLTRIQTKMTFWAGETLPVLGF